MFVSVVTCRFDPTRATFDSEPLTTFTRDKVVLSVREYFFQHGDTPHLAFVVTYRLIAPSALDGSSGRLDAAGQRRTQRPSTDDLRASLGEPARERFDLLRGWRNQTAQDQGIPAYSVLTNRQLVTLAEQAPTTKTGLTRVRGLGKKKSARYADAILAVIARGPGQAPESGGTAPAEGADSAEASAVEASGTDPSEVVPLFAPAAVGVDAVGGQA